MHESHSHRFHLKSPFPPGSFDLLCAARSIAKNAQESSAVFVGCPLSRFIAKQFEEQSENDIKAAWWYGVAPLVFCREQDLAEACFAVLNPEMKGAGSVRKLLDRSKFPYVLVSGAEELAKNADRVRDALRGNEQSGRESLYTQGQFAKPLRNYFGDEIDNAEFSSLLEEVALSSIIEFPDWSREDYRKRWALKRPERFGIDEKIDIEWIVDHGNKTSFDFLCTCQAPQLFPSMAIEFDGPLHDTDSGKIKDRLKDLICREAGLPLLRVDVDFAGPQPSDPKNYDYLRKSFKRKFAEFASLFVWFTASAWERAMKSVDTSGLTPEKVEIARVKALHRMFPTIPDVHRGLTNYLSLEEEYHEVIGRRPHITLDRHDVHGIRASMQLDRLTLQSPWLRIRVGVPRPLVDWGELEEIYCRRHVTEQALQKLKG